MSTILKRCHLLLVVGCLLTSGCATTKLLSVWKDPEYTGTPRNIMVISLMPNRAFRTQFEEEFANALKARGIDAISGSSLLATDSKLDKNVIVVKMRDTGADTVVITRVIDKKNIDSMLGQGANPRTSQWYGFYSSDDPGRATSTMAATQTNIYDLKTERLMWTAISDTWIEGSEDNLFLIRTFLPVIMKNLEENKIVGPLKTKRQ